MGFTAGFFQLEYLSTYMSHDVTTKMRNGKVTMKTFVWYQTGVCLLIFLLVSSHSLFCNIPVLLTSTFPRCLFSKAMILLISALLMPLWYVFIGWKPRHARSIHSKPHKHTLLTTSVYAHLYKHSHVYKCMCVCFVTERYIVFQPQMVVLCHELAQQPQAHCWF